MTARTPLSALRFDPPEEPLELPEDPAPARDTDPTATAIRQATIERLCTELLVAIGEDPTREGLVDTPARWARWWIEFADYDPGTVDRTFESVQVDQLVVVRGIQVWTLCEHHLLPFSVDLAMGYLTGSRVLGLSKLARMAHAAAHRLQVQERLVQDIATMISDVTGTDDVAVIGTGRHLCMSMRGIKTDGQMVTSSLHGRFREPALRSEFLTLADGR